MSNESREARIQEAIAKLSKRDLHAYNIWRGTDRPALAPSLNAKFFNLYLNGKGCEEIRRLNPQFGLGDIVAARIEGEWDKRRDEHLDQLLDQTSRRLQQTTMETADFVCDLLAVANREHGDRLRRYLQTGDDKELGDFRISSLPGLKSAIEILQKLTGDDRKQSVTLAGEVLHRQTEEKKQPTPEQASNVLKLLIGDKK
jgi:hypothetical protein